MRWRRIKAWYSPHKFFRHKSKRSCSLRRAGSTDNNHSFGLLDAPWDSPAPNKSVLYTRSLNCRRYSACSNPSKKTHYPTWTNACRACTRLSEARRILHCLCDRNSVFNPLIWAGTTTNNRATSETFPESFSCRAAVTRIIFLCIIECYL